jgi:hypothetical protein
LWRRLRRLLLRLSLEPEGIEKLVLRRARHLLWLLVMLRLTSLLLQRLSSEPEGIEKLVLRRRELSVGSVSSIENM